RSRSTGPGHRDCDHRGASRARGGGCAPPVLPARAAGLLRTLRLCAYRAGFVSGLLPAHDLAGQPDHAIIRATSHRDATGRGSVASPPTIGHMARLSLPPLAHLPAEAAHSGIRELANEALRTPGAIRLDVGQPNFPTPKHISEAGKRAIDENKTFYTHTQGLISLREKIVAKLQRVNGIASTPDRIACSPGGVGALAAVFGAVLEKGDEVLMPDPGWPNTRLMLTCVGAQGVFYPCSAADGFQPDIDAMEHLITPRTKLLLINSPNNPTGAVYPEATIERLVELAQRHNLWLVSDECYDQIILDGTWTSPASLAPDDPRIASVFTFSKSYAMTGWRIGYVAGSAELIDTATKVLESNSSCVSTITQVAAEAALDGPQDCVGEMVA